MRVGHYLLYYSEAAAAAGMEFVPQIVVFDLGALVEHAFETNSPAAPVLLHDLVAVRHRGAAGPHLLAVKGKAIAGGRLLETGRSAEAEEVRKCLADVPPETLARAERDLLGLGDRVFWEVTDRQINFEWVPPHRREGLRRFFATLGVAPPA